MTTYDRYNLPLADPGTTWPRYRKTATTPMVFVSGPFTVVTQEGPYDLPEGWEGMLAVDAEGYPYPISRENFESSYDTTPEEF